MLLRTSVSFHLQTLYFHEKLITLASICLFLFVGSTLSISFQYKSIACTADEYSSRVYSDGET